MLDPALIGHIAETMFVPLAKETVTGILSVQVPLCVGTTTAEISIQMRELRLTVVLNLVKAYSLLRKLHIFPYFPKAANAE